MNSPIHHLADEYRSSVLLVVAVGLTLFFILRCLYIHRNHRETKPKIESHKIEQVMPAVISNK